MRSIINSTRINLLKYHNTPVLNILFPVWFGIKFIIELDVAKYHCVYESF